MLILLYLLLGTVYVRLERIFQWHLQAAAVALYIYASVLTPFVGFFVLALMLFSPFFLFAWFYVLWFYFDYRAPETGGRPNADARNWKLYRYVAGYFPIKLIKTAELPTNHNYIIGAHPHGILGFGAFITYTTNATGFDKQFPGIHCALGTLRSMFWIPFKREETLYMTGLLAVSARSINYYLKKKDSGKAIAIVVGGAEELLRAHPNNYDVCIAKRKGFVRLAIQNGAYLVPSYCFGENNVYSQLPNRPGSFTRKLQNCIKSVIGFSPTLISGRGLYFPYSGVMPRRLPICCVVGRPIPVLKNPAPTTEEVDRLHKVYCDQLCQLFEDYKLKCGANECDHLNIC